MIYYIFYEWLYGRYEGGGSYLVKALNVFQYVTFRTAYASITALLISLIFGGRVIQLLRNWNIGQPMLRVGELRDSTNLAVKLRDKRDPVSDYLASQLSPEMQQTLKVYDGTSPLPEADQRRLIDELNGLLRGPSLYDEQRFAQVKLTDEAQKFIKLNPHGENLIRLNRVLLEEAYPAEIARTTKYSWNVNIPFFKATSDQNPLTSVSYIGPYLYLIFIIIVLLGSSNAVNLTDGLDGLAISITFVAMAALTAFTYITSDFRFAGYLGLVHRPEAAELTVFCGAMAGASLGFLWYNAPPAEVFMGDVGSLAIGGAIGTIAVLTKQEFMLLMVGGVFVLEILSVMIQVSVFKLTKNPKTGIGRRIFKMTPLHHHFEIQWEPRFGQRTVEPKVVFRFLILAILFALLSLSTLKLR